MTQADSWKLLPTPSFCEFIGATQIAMSQLDVTHGTSADSEFPRVSMSFLGRLSGTRADSCDPMRLRVSMSFAGDSRNTNAPHACV